MILSKKVMDGEEDTDGDGLNNLKEAELKTNSSLLDSDYDDLTDYDEVFKYKTDPTSNDTDEDGLFDDDEFLFGFDPFKKDTNNNGILDGDEKIKQTFEKIITNDKKGIEKVTLNIDATRNLQSTTRIDDFYYIDVYTNKLPGLIGVPVRIFTVSDFDEAEIVFTYNNLPKGTKEENLAILWSNEEGLYEIQKSKLNKKKKEIRTTTTHFSKYMVVDLEQWKNTWAEKITYGTPSLSVEATDICIVVDTSKSMKEKHFKEIRQGLKEFVNDLTSKDRISIVIYNGSQARILVELEDNRKSLLAAIKSIGVKKSTFSADGTTVKGLEEAVNSLAGSKSDNGKYIVLLSDDDMKYKKDVLQTAKKNNIKLFACNIANKNSFTNTRKMIQEVGGYYYQAVKHDSIRLSLLHSNIMVKDGVNTKDADGDGMPDVFEKIGIRVSNGQILKSNSKKKDTDGDGVDDFAEMNGSHIFAYDFFDYPAFTLLMESNPSMKDTDEDGYEDGYYEVKSTYMENGVIKESDEIVLLSHDDKIIEKTVINGLDELMKCAIGYTKKLNYMTDYRALQYMRYMTYSEYAGQGSNISNLDWIITAGRVELAFIKYVDSRTDLRLRFNKSWTFKDKEGNLIDGAHMMETLSSYYLWKYNFSYVPAPIPSVYNFRSLNNMAGWAGDLHTFMAMRFREKKGDTSSKILMYLPDCKTYDAAKKATQNYMGHGNSTMSMPDILADVDAVNLAYKRYYTNNQYNLYNSILGYYDNGETKDTGFNMNIYETSLYRFNLFEMNLPYLANIASKGEDGRKSFREVINFYVQKFNGKDWPIYDANKLKNHEIIKEARNGIVDGFCKFINTKKNFKPPVN